MLGRPLHTPCAELTGTRRLCCKLLLLTTAASNRMREKVYAYGIIRLITGVSASEASTILLSLFFRFRPFEVKMCRAPTCPRFTLPVAVNL